MLVKVLKLGLLILDLVWLAKEGSTTLQLIAYTKPFLIKSLSKLLPLNFFICCVNVVFAPVIGVPPSGHNNPLTKT